MTADEVIDLLTFMASFDRRTVGKADVSAWKLAIGDLPFGDAMDTVARHYGRDSTDWMMPKHVRDGVKAIRRERVARSAIAAPPPELTGNPAAYRQALAEGIRQAADGHAPPAGQQAITAGPLRSEPRENRPPVSLRGALAEFRRRVGAAKPRRAIASPQETALRQAAESRAGRESAEPEQDEEAS